MLRHRVRIVIAECDDTDSQNQNYVKSPQVWMNIRLKEEYEYHIHSCENERDEEKTNIKSLRSRIRFNRMV